MGLVKYLGKPYLSPEGGITILLFLTFLVMPMGTSPFTILGGCLVALWLFTGEWIRKRHLLFKATWLVPVLAMIVLSLLGLIYTPDLDGLGLKYAKKNHYWIYAVVFSTVVFPKKSVDRLMYAFMIGLLINALAGFLQAMGVVPVFADIGNRGYVGLYGGHNTLAMLLVLGLLIASFYFRNGTKKSEKATYALLMIAFFLHIVIMESRGGYLILVLMSPIIVHNLFPRVSLWATAGLYLLLIALTFSTPVVRERAVNTYEKLSEQYNEGEDFRWGRKYSKSMDRIYMWHWATKLFLQNPVLGVGTGGYKQATLNAGGDMGVDHPHNNILFVAANHGFAGLIVFLWLFWVLMRNGFKNRRSNTGFFILSSALVLFVGGFTETHIIDAGGAFLLSVTTGLQGSLKEIGSPMSQTTGIPGSPGQKAARGVFFQEPGPIT
ncbi:MAG: hypothetical protein CVU57_23830 [Deltaproteobacteria bacterium HGW-Deltaproteobacteria-15]|jgi:O-antigen ligase|nr:MAG: hypothetical protein CVU57_23830 [Deltaproteobacteria bacterium HGW-Deltaproteobacteria-15]PKO02361.1 MAG: hypothetical protein CVU43_08365 [Chloroflexi bacterium HGW-Chloroflexi-5]